MSAADWKPSETDITPEFLESIGFAYDSQFEGYTITYCDNTLGVTPCDGYSPTFVYILCDGVCECGCECGTYKTIAFRTTKAELIQLCEIITIPLKQPA